MLAARRILLLGVLLASSILPAKGMTPGSSPESPPLTAIAQTGTRLPPLLFGERWVYCSSNLLVDSNVDRVVDLINSSARGGYTAMMLADYKFQILDRMDERYFRNVERVKAAAVRARLDLIPAVFSIGYSNGILAHDPNLAEGLPAGPIPHAVRDGLAVLTPLPEAAIRNGDFEEARADRFGAFSFQDGPGKSTFADEAVKHSGQRACRIEPGKNGSDGGNSRVIQRVKVRPHACYRLSCWVKSQALTPSGGFRLMAMGGKPPGRTLTFHEGGVEADSDWTKLDVVFNSLDQDEVNIYAGIWGEAKGTIWIDDLRLEELSLVNVLRREGCPLRVTSSDGLTVYREGSDFEAVADPKLGRVPYAGEFEFEHEGPKVKLTPGSRIRNGDTVLLSWYHPVLTHGSQIMCCLSEPKLEAILRDQARRVQALFHPKTFFMSHDEIRVANWCRACQSRGRTPGQLLADNARRCVEILKSINPPARVAVWSDMFDPQHNAVENYYLVNGSLRGSWEGLPRGVIIANWNSGRARESLSWFSSRGHRQIIAGYYDEDDLAGLRKWESAVRGLEGILGFMYTTWSSRYSLLETYGVELRRAR